jgi:hypothetical protein
LIVAMACEIRRAVVPPSNFEIEVIWEIVAIARVYTKNRPYGRLLLGF